MRSTVEELQVMTNDDSESDAASEDEEKSVASSKFSYFSINSSVSERTARKKKQTKFSNYVVCVQSSLKWKAALFRGRSRRAKEIVKMTQF